jgi:hypothetical protein
MIPILGEALGTLLAKFGTDMVKQYMERKDDWDRITAEIEGKAKDYAIKALEYLAARGELSYELRPDAGTIELPPAPPSVPR